MPIGLKVPDELGNVSLEDTLRIARKADAAGAHSVWKGETSGTNTFMVLSAIARETEHVQLGTGIANVFSRTPILLAMSAATLDELSGDRAILGLGTSSDVLVKTWHSMEFERPLTRTIETTDIVRAFYVDDVVEYDGDMFDIGPYSVAMETPDEPAPIFNAAMGPKNRRFTAAKADGWSPLFLPISNLDEEISSIREAARDADRDPNELTIAPWIPFAISEDPERAEHLARNFIAQEMAMGYNNLVRQYGYGDVADEVAQAWRDGNRESASSAVSEDMLDDFSIYGTSRDCREDIKEILADGVDLPILVPPFHAEVEETEFMVDAVSPLFER